MTVLAPAPRPSRPPCSAAPEAVEPPLLPRTDPIARLPIVLLAPHAGCDCRCVMCDIWRGRKSDEIAAAEVAGWLPEWRALGVLRVVLTGGEALLHSDLWALCEPIAEAGIGLTLLTTGLGLEEHAERLVGVVDDVVVSLDGPREVHDRIRRVPGAYDRLARGVAATRAAAAAAGRTVAVSGRSTVQRENYRHLRATVAAAREIGLDRLSFLAADTTSEAFDRPGGWEPERAARVALGPEDLPLLAAELDALEREHAEGFRSGFIAESPEKLRARVLGHFAALLGRGGCVPVTCNAPWVSAVIEADGTVRPCFFHRPYGSLREDRSLEAVLNSEAAIAWRRGLDTRTDDTCRRCVCSLALRSPHPLAPSPDSLHPTPGEGERGREPLTGSAT